MAFSAALAFSSPARANVAPAIDSFTAAPAIPAPSQVVKLTLNAHDPDCATSCTSGCGAYIRSDLLVWSDDTGRPASAIFLNAAPSPSGSPWSATVDWIAPATEGNYVVTATVADSGTLMCGNRQTTYATLPITVSYSQPPVIASFTVSPGTVPVDGTAVLSVTAHDPAGGPLAYTFSASAGTIRQTSPWDSTAQWTAPSIAGVVTLSCTVTATTGLPVTARTTAQVVLGGFYGWLPLNGGRATRVGALLDGRIAIVDAVGGSVSAASTSGTVSWRAAGFSEPIAAAATASEIYVLERGARRISVLSTGGSTLRTIPCPGQMPAGLVAGPGAGELTVSDMAAARLHVISAATGQPLRSIGEGVLSFPSGLASPPGRVAVADPGLRRVVIFDSTGNVVATLGDDTMFVRPQGVAWDGTGNRLVVSDSFSAELTVMGMDGAVRGQLAGFGSGEGQITAPVDVQVVGGGLLAAPLAVSGQVALYQLLFSLPPVAPPTGVNAGDLAGDDGGAIQVNWTKSADDPGRVVSYRIDRALGASGDFAVYASAAAGSTSYVDRRTIDGQCYRYRVAASDGVAEGISEATPCARSANDLPPPAPGLASAQSQSPTTALVTWAPVAAPDLASYAVQVVGPERTWTLEIAAGGTQASLTSLLPDHTYQVSVAAVDTAGNVSPPALASLTTYPDEAPPTPTNVAASDTRRGGEIEVTWTEASGRVPVASFHVVCTPQIPGWPTVEADAPQPPARLSGLINRLAYVVTVTAVTPWGRSSAPSAGTGVMPTVPPRNLPVLPEVGWPADRPDADAGGITVRIPPQSVDRDLRLEYRARGSQMLVFFDGAPLATNFGDTAGVFADADIALPATLLGGTSVHFLELRNAAFPDPSALLSVRLIDLVPLPVEGLQSASFNTVVDLTWTWAEPHEGLTVKVSRSLNGPGGEWQDVPCTAPSLARCRDTFRPNGQKAWYRVMAVSPAGWESAKQGITGKSAYSAGPPPVTDLLVQPIDSSSGGWMLTWTPLSTALSPSADPSPVSSYRVYRQDAGGLAFLVEVPARTVQLPADALNAAGTNAVVRSVDALGRESQ